MIDANEARRMLKENKINDINPFLKQIEQQVESSSKMGSTSCVALLSNAGCLTFKASTDIIKKLNKIGYKAHWSGAYSNGICVSWKLSFLDKLFSLKEKI